MGLLSFFSRSTPVNLVRLPSGSFTVDANGKILVSTLSQHCPDSWAQQVGKHVVATFRAAQAAEIPLQELVAEYSALKLTARALRGGAIIFLSPQALGRR
jgi:hypothetical protein